MCCFYSFLCIVLSLSATNVPTFSIKGKLVEAGSRMVIDYADVMLFNGNSDQPVAHTFPDSEGNFSLSGIQPGKYNMLVKLIGFDIYTQADITIDNRQQIFDLGIIEMKPLEMGLAEVEVVAQKKQIIYKLDKKIIDAGANLMAGGGRAVDIQENT
ncbi:MAG: carboxypeptidase-like regulatory domain-containing protein, partial [Tannerellaceae bacterium]|nr:carboxypeptidase-like regulatory domain-containing protein [Tannerellaceae bacterium]